jgi:hypothetical protein
MFRSFAFAFRAFRWWEVATAAVRGSAGAVMMEDSKKPESVAVMSRNALIGTIVAIALNPISLILGYVISHWLQAPKLGIQFAVPNYFEGDKLLGPEGIQILQSSPRMATVFRRAVEQSAAERPQCTSWMDHKPWDSNCEDVVRNAFSGLKNSLNLDTGAIAKNIQRIHAWKLPARLVLEPVNTPDESLMRLMQVVQGGRFDQEQALRQFEFYLTDEKEGLKDLERLESAFDKMINQEVPNQEQLQFNVGILNTGESDGVVFDTGKVKIGETELVMVSDYTAVKAHSFEAVKFTVLIPEKEQQIREIVKNQNVEQPFSLWVNVGTKHISASGVLPKKVE